MFAPFFCYVEMMVGFCFLQHHFLNKNTVQYLFAEETRPVNHVCLSNEIEQDEEYFGRKQECKVPKATSAEEEFVEERKARTVSRKRKHFSNSKEISDETLGDEDDSDEAAERFLQQAKRKNRNKYTESEVKQTSQFYAETGKSSLSPGHDDLVRSKVKDAFEGDLALAVKEIQSSDPSAKLPDPAIVASAVEDALLQLFGKIQF